MEAHNLSTFFANSFRPVGNSPDLERVLALPRRSGDISTRISEDLVQYVSELVRRPGGSITLFPIQVAALIDFAEQNGGLAPIGVGGGKTIISLLLPRFMKSKVAVVMVPPSLRAKLTEVEYPALQKELVLPALAGSSVRYGDEEGMIHVVSYSQLSSQTGAQILEDLKPDLIICDEAHALKDMSAARTKRFFRYLRNNQDTRTVFLSGSMTSKSLRDFAHLSNAALREGSPTPLSFPVIVEWAGALDAKEEADKTPPGALKRLCQHPDEDVLEAYQRRLRETPGVIASGADIAPNGLIIHERKVVTPSEVDLALVDLRAKYVRPDGEELVYTLDVHRAGLQLSAGMFTRWIWPRGESEDVISAWMKARKDWHQEQREYLKNRAREHMDSPGFLELAARRWFDGYVHEGKQYPPQTHKGPLPTWGARTFPAWEAIRHQAEPETEAVWIDDFMVKDAVRWGKQHKGVIWYGHRDLGRRIAEAGGFDLFGDGLESARGLAEMAAGPDAGKRTIVCSIHAHHKGHNLQAWHKMLVTTWPSSGSTTEQLLGRVHRTGQKADDVEVWTYVHTEEARRSFIDSRSNSRYIEKITGLSQRLNKATITFKVDTTNNKS